MAVIAFTVFMPVDDRGNNIPNAIGVQWPAMANGDTGAPYVVAHRMVKSVQVKGTLGTGGTCTIEGTLDPAYNPAGTALTPTYAALSDPQGNSLAINALKIESVQEHVVAIRPNISAGDGSTALTCTMLVTGPNL